MGSQPIPQVLKKTVLRLQENSTEQTGALPGISQ